MANITNEVDASGAAIADFIGDLGVSVAEGQVALDKNTGTSAEVLSKILVELPAVIQEVFDDNGNPTAANIINSKVPMSTIILPIAYQFTRVFFQADLKLSELDKTRGVRLVKNAAALKGEAKVGLDLTSIATGGLPGVNAGASSSISSSERQRDSTSSTDQAIATLHFEATLEPRREIQIPTPVRLRIAPRITVAVTEMTIVPMVASVPAGSGATTVSYAPETRTATVTVGIFKADGTDNTINIWPNIKFSADASDLSITKSDASTHTLKVVRSQGSENTPLPVLTANIIRLSLGSITEQITLNI